jgi:hypothetical protein
MRFLTDPRAETHHNHDDDETGLHLAPRCCCQLANVSLHPNMFTIFYVVTCNYHEYCYEQKAASDYPVEY